MVAGIAVVASAICYAGAGLYIGKRLAHVPVLIVGSARWRLRPSHCSPQVS